MNNKTVTKTLERNKMRIRRQEPPKKKMRTRRQDNMSLRRQKPLRKKMLVPKVARSLQRGKERHPVARIRPRIVLVRLNALSEFHEG